MVGDLLQVPLDPLEPPHAASSSADSYDTASGVRETTGRDQRPYEGKLVELDKLIHIDQRPTKFAQRRFAQERTRPLAIICRGRASQREAIGPLDPPVLGRCLVFQLVGEC